MSVSMLADLGYHLRMPDTAQDILDGHLKLAQTLGEAIVNRGVLQNFFVSPVLPMEPLTIERIGAAWQRLAFDIKAGRVPELLSLDVQIPGEIQTGQVEACLERLHAEIDYYEPIFAGLNFTNCRLGGASPPLLDEDQLSTFLADLDDVFKRMRGAEWTLGEESKQFYDETTIKPHSLLGIGPTARGYVFGQLRYRFDSYPLDSPFDPHAECATGREVTPEEERRRYVVYRLESPMGLRPVQFSARFGEGLAETFGEELQHLLNLSLLKEEGGSLLLTSAEPATRFAATAFFVDPLAIEAAWEALREEPPEEAQAPEIPSSAPYLEPEPETGTESTLRLEAPGVVLDMVLCDYWEDRPCFHHRGALAFFIPSDLPEGSCRHSAVEEWLLDAFRGLFDRVYDEQRPDSIDSLTQSLLSGGQRGHFRTNARPMPVILSLSG